MPDHRRGRKLGPIEGCGPAAQFGHRLRELLEAQGTPSRKTIARASNVGSSTVSTIDNGRQVPTADKVNDYLNGLGVPKAERDRWAAERDAFAARAERLHPDLSQARTCAQLRLALLQALAGEGVDADTAWQRITEAGTDGPAMTHTPAPPSRSELDAVFAGSPGALTPLVLPWVVYAAGGTRADITHWRDRFNTLPHEPNGPAGDTEPVDVPDADTPAPAGSTAAPVVIPRQHPSTTPAQPPAGTGGAPIHSMSTPQTLHAEAAERTSALTPAGTAPTPTESTTAPNTAAHPSAVSPTAVGGRTPWLRMIPARAWATAACICGVIAVAAAIGVLHLDLRPRRLAMPISVPTPLPEQPGRKAGVFLEDTATLILQHPDPALVGAFAYIHRKTWAVETTPDNGAPGKTGTVETVTEEKLWWSDTARGLLIITETRPGRIDRSNTEYLQPGPPTQIGPPTADPDVLWLRLEDRHPARLGPVRCLRAVTDLIDTYPLDTAQRAAVLRLLAGCDGITYRDQARDRNRRPGIAISADDSENDTRDTLIIDPATGAILAREVARIDTPDPTVTEQILYLDAGRTNEAG